MPGEPIFPLPVDSGGNGFLAVSNFEPGQQLALITLNINQAYRDWQPLQFEPQRFPPFSYSLMFSLVNRGVSSFTGTPQPSKTADLNLDANSYQGLPFVKDRLPSKAFFERERAHQIEATGYDVLAPIKTASLLSKGEERTFTEILRTVPPPPIESEEDIELSYPEPYYGQDGRLVAIGAHCYIFLTTENNQGFPDSVRFTERRLAAFALEFDTNIFPKVQAAFGSILGYHNEGPGPDNGPIWKGIDRDIVLTADDFDENGNLRTQLPGRPDFDIGRDSRVVVAIMNLPGGAGGLYSNWERSQGRPSEEEEGPQREEESYAWSTCFIDAALFPASSDDWSQPYAVLAHEFEHKLYADYGLPNSTWLNEGLAQLAVYAAGYTLQSGRTAGILVDQIRTFLNNANTIPVPLDAERVEGVDIYASYGARFLFFLYIAEHYGPGTIHKLYDLGGSDPIELVERATGEDFEVVFTKWSMANFIDGIYVSDDSPLNSTDNPWLHYLTFDIRSTVDLEEENRLPGVPVMRLPGESDTYPVTRSLIPLSPYCAHYAIIENGDGRDLSLTLFADPNFRFYLLPVAFNDATNSAEILPGGTFPHD
ncbi:MAG: hypothetical protein A2Y63_01160 [Candidatus Riflebacteria bacterium RBG_13_59_9]|nr:MAG: hypothetical protein A2Y63_01160 [Candidatus Riflebacteria bacterium RBG_13_59_9]